jgi:hypothetical protein
MFIKLSAGAKKNVKDFASKIKDSSALDTLTGQWMFCFRGATTIRITTFDILAIRITTLSIIGKMHH